MTKENIDNITITIPEDNHCQVEKVQRGARATGTTPDTNSQHKTHISPDESIKAERWIESERMSEGGLIANPASADTQSLSDKLTRFPKMGYKEEDVRLAVQEDTFLIWEYRNGNITFKEMLERREKIFGSKLC